MSLWVDFAVYVAQVLLFWVLLPRQAHSFGVPMIGDRNPEWLAAHPEVRKYFERSRGFLRIWYAWAAICVVVLLLQRLGVWHLGAAPVDASDWQQLKDTLAVLMGLGMVGWFAWAALWFRWLKRAVPLADRRSATLAPRTTRTYLSLPWRVTVETLTVLHLAAWLVVGLTVTGLDPEYWKKFTFVVAMTVFFAAFAWLVPLRRQGYADRLFGETYRRVEMRVAYVLRLSPIVAGVIAIGELLTYGGFDRAGPFDRAGHLALVLLVSGLVSAFLFLRPAGPVAAPPTAPRPAAGDSDEIDPSFGSTIGGFHERRAS